jgi:flagellum-specific peptidoglycan hydrolase FlgJ
MKPNEFLSKFGPSAQENYQKNKILFASVQLAQLVQELGWNVTTCVDMNTGKDSLNLFNIKGSGPAGSVSCWTTEYDANDKPYKVIAQFRAYNNYTESFDDHAQLLLTKSWYQGVRDAKTPREQCEQLYKCGYATDPTYAQSLVDIIEYYNLKQFDVLKEEPTVTWQEKAGLDAVASLAKKIGTDGKTIIQSPDTWTQERMNEPAPTWLVMVLLDRIAK